MNISRANDIHVIDAEYKKRAKWEQWFLLMSDEHYDAIECDRKLLRKHHDQAKERNAPILKFGDVFDCMGGKYDPRTHKGDIRPEHVRKDYFDAITQDAIGFYSDYNVMFVSDGNHEENVLKRHETDLIGNLARGVGAERGSYSGWIRFNFRNSDGGSVRKFDLYYDHGMGGNSPVSKGVIGTNRRGVVYDADIFVSGHNHNRWVMELMRETVDKVGKIKPRRQVHINSGTYLKKGVERDRFASGYGQPNMGGVWLQFYMANANNGDIQFRTVMA